MYCRTHLTPPPEDLRQVRDSSVEGLALIFSSRPLTDLSRVRVAQGLKISRGQINARAKAFIIKALRKGYHHFEIIF